MRVLPALLAALLAACGGGSGGSAPIPPLPGTTSTFVNWENLSVHPVDVAGGTLLVCNTPDARLERFDLSCGRLRPLGSRK